MKKPITNNLTAYMQGRNLNIFQKADAIIEYNKLLDYINNLEEAISVTRCCTTFTPTQIINVLEDCNGLLDAKEYFLDENL